MVARNIAVTGHDMATAGSHPPSANMYRIKKRTSSAAGRMLHAAVLLALCGFSPWATHAETFPGDKAALLDFYKTLSSPGDLRASWSNSTDPCDDGWVRIQAGAV